MTTIRLVSCGQDFVRNALSRPFHPVNPALLVSYAYWELFSRIREGHCIRDYALDSGAFTVHNTGGSVDLAAYIDFCRERLETDPLCTEVFSLDVVGDWRGSERNAEAMWAAGVPAIPVFHMGEPEGLLSHMAQASPKVGLGGMWGCPRDRKRRWVEQAFARIWPHRIHGLGTFSEPLMMAVPFHSVDSSTWMSYPSMYGNWRRFGRIKGVRGGGINLRVEAEHYLAVERRLKERWEKELARLEETAPPWPPAREPATTTA